MSEDAIVSVPEKTKSEVASFPWGLVLFSVLALGFVCGVYPYLERAGSQANGDARHFALRKTTLITPTVGGLPNDTLFGIRPGQSLDEASSALKTALDYRRDIPTEEKNLKGLDVYSDDFVKVFSPFTSTASRTDYGRVVLSSPASGSRVLAIYQSTEFKGAEGYPTVDALRDELVARYGEPTSTSEESSAPPVMESLLTLTWVRGNQPCTSFECQYPCVWSVDTFERPADTSVGVPLVPIIVARIKSRGVQSAKAAEVDVLVADYGMMATASDVDKAAIAEAQTSFDKLPGPKPIFPENTKDSK